MASVKAWCLLMAAMWRLVSSMDCHSNPGSCLVGKDETSLIQAKSTIKLGTKTHSSMPKELSHQLVSRMSEVKRQWKVVSSAAKKKKNIAMIEQWLRHQGGPSQGQVTEATGKRVTSKRAPSGSPYSTPEDYVAWEESYKAITGSLPQIVEDAIKGNPPDLKALATVAKTVAYSVNPFFGVLVHVFLGLILEAEKTVEEKIDDAISQEHYLSLKSHFQSVQEELAWTDQLLQKDAMPKDVQLSYLFMVQHSLATKEHLLFNDGCEKAYQDEIRKEIASLFKPKTTRFWQKEAADECAQFSAKRIHVDLAKVFSKMHVLNLVSIIRVSDMIEKGNMDKVTPVDGLGKNDNMGMIKNAITKRIADVAGRYAGLLKIIYNKFIEQCLLRFRVKKIYMNKGGWTGTDEKCAETKSNDVDLGGGRTQSHLGPGFYDKQKMEEAKAKLKEKLEEERDAFLKDLRGASEQAGSEAAKQEAADATEVPGKGSIEA